jgi:hypothetical protein
MEELPQAQPSLRRVPAIAHMNNGISLRQEQWLNGRKLK